MELCYRVIQVTVFFNFSLTDTKKRKHGKTQPFLFRIYVDIFIFWCLSMARWKNLVFQGCANRHQLASTGTFSHPQTTPGRVWGCRGILLVSICFCWRQFVHGWCLEDVLGVFGWCLCMFVVFGCVWVLISCRVENLYCFGTAQLKAIFFHLAILRYQNIKMSTYILNKNGWVLSFSSPLVPVREKLKNTVTWITL